VFLADRRIVEAGADLLPERTLRRRPVGDESLGDPQRLDLSGLVLAHHRGAEVPAQGGTPDQIGLGQRWADGERVPAAAGAGLAEAVLANPAFLAVGGGQTQVGDAGQSVFGE
jgi:hypothetical protein